MSEQVIKPQRLIAVGDIHGQYDLLVDLMRQIRPRPNDQLVFLGDYIDRGPKAPQVLDYLIVFKEKFPHTVTLRGNHEQMFLDALADAKEIKERENRLFGKLFSLGKYFIPETVELFLSTGGDRTLQAYRPEGAPADPLAILNTVPDKHIRFLERTRFYFRQGPFLFVHAGVDPADPEGKDSTDSFLWERRPTWVKVPGWDKVVVHGHTPVVEPFFSDLDIDLDTGAGHQGRLTACDVLTRQIWQAGPPVTRNWRNHP